VILEGERFEVEEGIVSLDPHDPHHFRELSLGYPVLEKSLFERSSQFSLGAASEFYVWYCTVPNTRGKKTTSLKADQRQPLYPANL